LALLIVSCCCCITLAVVQDFSPGKNLDQCSSALCRSNLHGLACQLPKQILYMGLTCFSLEYWLEREIGRSKGRTRGKITARPGHAVVAMELENRAQHEAALVLGMVLQEAEDGQVSIPSSSSGDGGSRVQDFVQAAVLVNQYRMAGPSRLIERDVWAAAEVGMFVILIAVCE
jgi:hypothetical protein